MAVYVKLCLKNWITFERRSSKHRLSFEWILLFLIINEPLQLSMITFKWEMNINTESSRGQNEFIRLLPFHNGNGLKSDTKPQDIIHKES